MLLITVKRYERLWERALYKCMGLNYCSQVRTALFIVRDGGGGGGGEGDRSVGHISSLCNHR